MMIGQAEARVGTKNQVAFPKKFRDEFGERIIVTKGLEQNLIVLSEGNWRSLLEGTQGKPFIDKRSREVQRYLLGNASELELDTKGRCVIPEYLRVYAKIEQEIVFVGIERFVEIWDKKNWMAHQELIAPQIGSIAQRLTDFIDYDHD